jgi:hypothetical protein
MSLSMTQRAAGTVVAFATGALSAKIFHKLPFDKTSIPTATSRGLIGAGVFLLSPQIARLVADRLIPPLDNPSRKAEQRAKENRELAFMCTWLSSTFVLGAIIKVAMNRLNWPISLKEIGVNLTLSTLTGFTAIAVTHK